jgi:hypothetical protein
MVYSPSPSTCNLTAPSSKKKREAEENRGGRRAREVAGVETWCGERRGGEKARVDLYRGSWALSLD